jgi:hypothetical protein
MRQAQARKIRDSYLDAPKRSERHLHVVEEPGVAVLDEPHPEPFEIETPDWAEAFSDPRWDDRLGYPDYEERDGRRTVLVTGRPEGKALPRRESTPVTTARVRRHSPTRARLAGRPDRVALWAVGLGLLMAAMAGFTAGGHGHASHAPAEPPTPQLLSR